MMRNRPAICTLLILGLMLAVPIQTLCADGIKRSDVAFANQASPEAYRQYGATVVAWGFRPWELLGEAFYAEWKRGVDEAHSVGARYQARVELDAGWRGMIDFDPDFRDAACIDLDGQAIVYRFWNSQHKGHPPYYFCTNAPSYRKYLIEQAREALSGEPDMLLIDGIHTTANAVHQGGCFCPHCMTAFRSYVAANVPRQTLKELQIEALDRFDYGRFLRGRKISSKQFSEQVLAWPSQLPLAEEYLTFQQQAARDFLAEFHQDVDEISSRPIDFATSTPLRHARDWYPASVIDHFTIETILHPEKKQIPEDQIFRYKLADALGKRILVTGMGHNDWTYVRDHNLRGMVQAWIAQSYAYGHNFLVPHNVWCGEGEARYESQPGDYDHLYQFVRRHADLLDGYEPVAQIGLLYSHRAMRRWKPEAKRLALELTQKNVPFRYVVAGDDWLENELTKGDLDGLSALITTKTASLNEEQQTVLGGAADYTVQWPDEERLFELVPRQILVEGATKVTVLPRMSSANASAPGVCHLLNGNYDADQDAMISTGEFTVHLAKSLYGREIKSATLLSPGQPNVPCVLNANDKGVTITIPSIALWAILKLEMDEAVGNDIGNRRATEPAEKLVPGLPQGFASQWPSLRGPGGYGIAKPANTMTRWDVETGEGVLWSVKVPLPGKNSPILWGDRVFMSGGDKSRQAIFCFDANTGKQLWARNVETAVDRQGISEGAGFAAPTMATDGKLVFAIFATGELAALDFDGNPIWQKNLGLPENPYGMGSSLISDGQRLFIQYDHRKTQEVLALECGTGKPVWQTAREHISWSSPILAETETGLQLILNDEKNVTSYDPASGKQLWQIDCLGGEVAPSPAFNGKDVVFVANEYAKATAIKLTNGEPKVLWEYDEYLPEISSPLAAGGLIFIPTTSGDLACLNEATGHELWVHEFDAELLSSPIQVGDRVYLIDYDGVVHIFKLAPDYQEIATIDMGERVLATPAFVNGRIFIRTEESLYCIRERTASEDPFQRGGVAPGNSTQRTPMPGDETPAINLPWMPWDLNDTLGGSITVGQLGQIVALPSFKACSKIRADIEARGWVFYSLEANAYKKSDTDFFQQSNKFMWAVSSILTEEQMGRLEQGFGPDAEKLNAAPMPQAVENRVDPGRNLDFPGTDWAQFMGPHRTGVSDETGLLRKWPENGPPVLWTVPVGAGNAGPVIVENRVYILDREEEKDRDAFRCYDLMTGKELWNHTYATEGKIMFPGSRAMPAIDEGLAYTAGSHGDLHCIDLNTRKVIWSVNFWKEFSGGDELPAWGIAQNPLIYKNLVIIAVQALEAGVVAFNKKTGKVEWISEPLGSYGYVSPNLVKIDGDDHLAIVGASLDWRGKDFTPYQGVVGIDPDDGETLWKYKGWDCGLPIPQVVDAGKNRLYIGAGYKAGCSLFEVKRKGLTYVTEEIYKTQEFGTHIHPPIVHEDHFYAHCSDSKGRMDGLSCMSIDGKIKWQSKKNPVFNKGGFIIADGMILSVDGKFGILYLTEATPERFNILSKVRLLDKSNCWAPLALSRGKLIIRDQRKMKCLLVK